MTNRAQRKERGQTTAEFVVVLPFLLLLFFLMVDFGWLLKNWIVVTNSAREAARCAIVNTCSSEGEPTDPANLILGRLRAGLTTNLDVDEDGDIDFDDVTVMIQYHDNDGDGDPTPGDSIIVLIEGRNVYISPVMPFLGMIGSAIPDPMPLCAREEMLIEFNLDPTWEIDRLDPGEEEARCPVSR